MANISKIQLYSNSPNMVALPYGTCSDAANVTDKTVSITDFNLTGDTKGGTSVRVKFTNANTATIPTLNVNGSGKKNIVAYGTTTPTIFWEEGSIVDFTYDGSNWVMTGFGAMKEGSVSVDDKVLAVSPSVTPTAIATASGTSIALSSTTSPSGYYITVTGGNEKTTGTAMPGESATVTEAEGYISAGTETITSSATATANANPKTVYYNISTEERIDNLTVGTAITPTTNKLISKYTFSSGNTLTVPKDKKATITLGADTALDTTSTLTVTGAAYRAMAITTAANGTTTVTNNGTTNIKNNGVSTITNNATLTAVAGSTATGNVTVTAYRSDGTSEGAQVVSGGHWVTNIVTPTTTVTGPHYGSTTVSAMDAGTLSASGTATVGNTSGSVDTVNPGTNTISKNSATNVSVSTVTTTTPTSGYYVAADASTAKNSNLTIAVSGTGTATASVSKAGYVSTSTTSTGTVSASGTATVTVNSKSASVTYFSITSATASKTDGSADATANAGEASIVTAASASATAEATGFTPVTSGTTSHYVTASASANAGQLKATGGSARAYVTASSASVTAGYSEGISTSTSASDTGTVTGNTVTSKESKASDSETIYIPDGSASTPDTTITANPSAPVWDSTNNYYKLTASATKSITPTVTEGYIVSGAAGTVTVSGSSTLPQSTVATTTDSDTATALTKNTKYKVSAGYYPDNRYYQCTVSTGSLSASGSVTTSVSGSATPGTNTISKNSNTNVSVGSTTTTKPTSGYYVAMDASTAESSSSIKVSYSGTATASVATAGYVDTSTTDEAILGGSSSPTVTVSAKAASTTYMPITGAQFSNVTISTATTDLPLVTTAGYTGTMYASEITIPISKHLNVTAATATSGTADSTATTYITNNAYRQAQVVNTSNATISLVNNGGATSILNSTGSISVTQTTTAGSIAVSAYDSSSALVESKTIVSSGKWVYNTVTPSTSAQGPYYGATNVSAMTSAEFSNITTSSTTTYFPLVTTAGYSDKIYASSISVPSTATLPTFTNAGRVTTMANSATLTTLNNSGTVTTINNTGTVTDMYNGNSAGTSIGCMSTFTNNSGSFIGTFTNNSSKYQTIYWGLNTFNNTGLVNALINSGTITELNNKGTISGGSTYAGGTTTMQLDGTTTSSSWSTMRVSAHSITGTYGKYSTLKTGALLSENGGIATLPYYFNTIQGSHYNINPLWGRLVYVGSITNVSSSYKYVFAKTSAGTSYYGGPSSNGSITTSPTLISSAATSYIPLATANSVWGFVTTGGLAISVGLGTSDASATVDQWTDAFIPGGTADYKGGFVALVWRTSAIVDVYTSQLTTVGTLSTSWPSNPSSPV